MVEKWVQPKCRVNPEVYLDKYVEKFINSTARLNHWRVASHYELDDLIQDGYLCFAKCCRSFKPAYGDGDNEQDRRAFMTYLKQAFIWHITDLSNDKTAVPELPMAAFSSEQEDTFLSRLGELGDVSLLLLKAPAEIVDIIKAICVEGKADGPYERSKFRKKSLPGSDVPTMVKGRLSLRETTDQFYDRCLGQEGVLEKLRTYFLKDEIKENMSL